MVGIPQQSGDGIPWHSGLQLLPGIHPREEGELAQRVRFCLGLLTRGGEAASADEHRDGSDSGDEKCGNPDTGDDHRPGQREADPHQGRGLSHAHASGRLEQRLVDTLQTDDGVPEDGQRGVERDREEGRQDADPDDRDQQAQEGEGRNGQPDGTDRVGDRLERPDARHDDGQGHRHDGRDEDRLDHQADVLVGVERDLGLALVDELPHGSGITSLVRLGRGAVCGSRDYGGSGHRLPGHHYPRRGN